MLTRQDFKKIGSLFHASEKRLERRLTERLTGTMNSRMESLIRASEQRLTGTMNSRMESLIGASEKRTDSRMESLINASEKRLTSTLTDTLTKTITDSVVEAVGDMINDNILPQIQEVRDDLSELAKTVSQLPDKDFVTRLVNRANGDSIGRDRGLDSKIHASTNVLRKKQILNEKEVRVINSIKVFDLAHE